MSKSFGTGYGFCLCFKCGIGKYCTICDASVFGTGRICHFFCCFHCLCFVSSICLTQPFCGYGAVISSPFISRLSVDRSRFIIRSRRHRVGSHKIGCGIVCVSVMVGKIIHIFQKIIIRISAGIPGAVQVIITAVDLYNVPCVISTACYTGDDSGIQSGFECQSIK